MMNTLSRLWRRPRIEDVLLSPDKTTASDIRACFRLILGREPAPEEWPGHSSRVGEDLKAVVSSYLQSQEFHARGMLHSISFKRYVVTEIMGVKVALYPDDIDVGSILIRGVYEPHVTALFETRIKPGMRVVDVGANCGYFTFLARKLVGESGTVYAVEPHVSNIRLLEIGRRENGYEGQEFNALRGFAAGLSKRPLIVSEFFPGMLQLQNVTGEAYL